MHMYSITQRAQLENIRSSNCRYEQCSMDTANQQRTAMPEEGMEFRLGSSINIEERSKPTCDHPERAIDEPVIAAMAC